MTRKVRLTWWLTYPYLADGGGGDRRLYMVRSKESRMEEGGPLRPRGGSGSRGGMGGGGIKSLRGPKSLGGRGSLLSKESLSSKRAAGLS